MTNRRLFAFFWIAALFLTQEMSGFIFPRWAPPFVLIGVLFYALTEGPVFGAVAGCFAGFFFDILGVGKLGGSMAILSGIGAISGLSASKIFYDGFLTPLLLPAAANYLLCFFSLLFYENPAQGKGLPLGLFRESLILSQPFLTALVSPAVFSFLKKAGKKS